tara:strand:+ start:214 stop:1068 length:855 start_codon:yes stop_codon:yes gene_type:complete
MNDIVFIADFFADEVPGGGELNNEELIQILKNRGHDVYKIKSQQASPDVLSFQGKNKKYIVANFLGLSEISKKIIQSDYDYLIYEHDHKYVKSRNPADYENFLAPQSEIINFDFYKNAKAVLCQSQFHADIVKSNLHLDNIVSLGGNLWSTDSLSLMRKMSKIQKNESCAIMVTNNWHKNTNGAIKLCKSKGWDCDLIYPCSYEEFLTKLGKNEKFVFLPKTPETLCRIVVEARMMGVSTITNKLLGATKEDWYHLKGEELIDKVMSMREEIPNTVLSAFQRAK